MANEIWLAADNIIKMEGRRELFKLALACMRPDSVLAGGKPTHLPSWRQSVPVSP